MYVTVDFLSRKGAEELEKLDTNTVATVEYQWVKLGKEDADWLGKGCVDRTRGDGCEKIGKRVTPLSRGAGR